MHLGRNRRWVPLDIEIVNEGEGTDAFAVSTQSFYILYT